MKRFAVLLLMLAIAGLSAACGGDGDGNATATAAAWQERATLQAQFTQSAGQIATIEAQAAVLEAELTAGAETQGAAPTAAAMMQATQAALQTEVAALHVALTAGAETQAADAAADAKHIATQAARAQATQAALQTELADLNAGATAGAERLATEAARAQATQAALQTELADLNAGAETQVAEAAADAEQVATQAARAQATQAAIQADLFTLEADASHVSGQLDDANATHAAASAALAATLEAETAHNTTVAEALGTADARVYALEQTATPVAAQLVTLAAELEALRTEVREYVEALPTATPTVRFTHLPPPTGTPPVTLGDVYIHSSEYFQIASPDGWRVGETADGVTWINYDFQAVVHAFYTLFDTPPNRFQLLGYATGQLDKSFAFYDDYEVTGVNFTGEPLVMDFALWDEGYKYISRQWFGAEENVGWFLRVVVPDNYPDLLEHLGEILLPTYRVFPDGAALSP